MNHLPQKTHSHSSLFFLLACGRNEVAAAAPSPAVGVGGAGDVSLRPLPFFTGLCGDVSGSGHSVGCSGSRVVTAGGSGSMGGRLRGASGFQLASGSYHWDGCVEE